MSTVLTRAWLPGPRAITAGATFARLDDSRRDYNGIRTVWCTPDAYVGFDAAMRTIIIYTTNLAPEA